MRPNFYRSFEEFAREELSSSSRVGFSLDDLIEESVFDSELGSDEADDDDS